MRNIGRLTVIAVALLSRFLPHPPNMTAIGALAIFSGFAIRPRLFAFVLPLAVLFLTDFALGFHNTMLFTYGAWTLVAGISALSLGVFSWLRLGYLSLATSTIFFVVTNFGVWAVGGLYPKTVLGLSECFIAAIPFFGNQLAGDILFTGAIFALWTNLEGRVSVFRKNA